MRETDLYAPIKVFLESEGFEVKAEIGPADVVAIRDGEPPLVVELKTSFSLALIHQAVARQALTDEVYIAVPRGRGRAFLRSLKRMTPLCRRLGLGLMTVALETRRVLVHVDPGPYAPRRDARALRRLTTEFDRRRGDPNRGGATGPRMTAYRQDAQAIAAHLSAFGPSKGAEVAAATGVARATRMMADNHYGWFIRVERGVYALTEAGSRAVSPAEAA